jgi:hypothetical protein
VKTKTPKAGPPKGYKPPSADMDGFDAREYAEEFGYWKDPRWKQVDKLRKANDNDKANTVVFRIRRDWGVP